MKARARHCAASALLPLLVLPTALLALACGGGGGGSGQAVELGGQKFLSVCATCHGRNAEGMPRLGKNLHDNAFVHGKTDAELVAFLKEGRPSSHPDNTQGVDMPPKGGDPTMTDQDLEAIVAYLRTL